MKRRDRLRRPGDFQRVLRTNRLYAGRTLVAFAVPGRSPGARVGVTVSRKIRGSVRRNRAKRRLREVARRWLLADDSPLSGRGITYDVVVIARPPAVDAAFDELRQEGEAFLRRLVGAGKGQQR